MAVTKVTRKSAAKEAKDGKPAKPAFEYQKIITPNTKRGGKDEASKASYPTFAELAQMLNGKVEFELDTDGNPKGSCVCSYIIDGWNLESNQNASFAASNTPEAAIGGFKEKLAALAAKLGITKEKALEMLME